MSSEVPLNVCRYKKILNNYDVLFSFCLSLRNSVIMLPMSDHQKSASVEEFGNNYLTLNEVEETTGVRKYIF